MGGYIGARAGSLSTTTVANVQDVTATDTTPEVTIINNTHEDTDGGREGKVIFKGQQSGGEESTLAEIQASHDGTADDEKGDLIFRTNDGSDGASPTERMRIDSAGAVTFTSDDTSDQFVIQNNDAGSGSAPDMVLYRNSASPADGDTIGRIDYRGEDDGGTARDYVTLYSKISDASTGTPAGSFHIQTRNGTNQSDRLVVDGSGNVGIGTSSPTSTLTVKAFEDSVNGGIRFESNDGSENATIDFNNSANLRFRTNGSDRMRIDSSGNLLVGRTAEGDSNAGVTLRPDGFTQFTRSGSLCGSMNRLSSDGSILRFQKDGSAVGFIGSVSGLDLFISSNRGAGLRFTDQEFFPVNASGATRDNAVDLGHSVARFDDIYATNSTIQTSDEREKQQIASLTDAEMTAATAISKLFKTFKWNDSVAEKGDAARTHSGVIAQQVETAMSDAGLSAGNYAFFISTTWWEADETYTDDEGAEQTRTNTYDTQEEAPEGATERNRKGIRYPELLSFIGAATEQRLTSIEARLDALEAE